jgi:TonB-dependent starch-binding outer membrane protein SusC
MQNKILKTIALICIVVLGFSAHVFAQQGKTVTGTILGENNATLPGAAIQVKGTTIGTISDVNGKFTLQVPATADVLTISFMGMEPQEIQIGSQSVINVTLVPSSVGLEGLVVVGYGVQKKKLVTGSTVEVKGDAIAKRNTVSPMTALQSLSTGVNITKTSGEPGAGFKVNIRGVGTIGNSQPLYIVDGLPKGDINNIDPSDIESMDVLKDAASAAIYGARAANGVILVTTKKGKLNSMEVSYDGYYGVQNLYKTLPLLNATEYLMIQNEGRVNSNLAPYGAADYNKLLDPKSYAALQAGTWNGTNWLKEMQNPNAPIQNHAINISGGGKASVYSMGFSYTSQEGIMGYPVQSQYDRYSFRINSSHVLLHKNFDVIKFGENLLFTYTQNHGIATGNMWWNDVYSAIQTNPVLPMYAYDETDLAYPYHYSIPWNSNTSNPEATMTYRGSNENKNTSTSANVFMEIQPIKGLVYRTSFSINPSSYSSRSYTPIFQLGPVNQALNNGVSQSAGGGLGSWLYENTLNYKFDIGGEHHFDVLAGMSAEKWGLGTNLSTNNKNSVFSDFEHAYIDNANVQATASISGSPWGEGSLASYFGRINYDYKETYLLTLVVRSDGSSNFADGHRWGTFPSVSAGWVLSKESFMEATKSYINFLKVRGSWGQNGNQAIPGFQYVSQIAYNTNSTRANYYFGADKLTPTNGAYPLNIPTFDLKWETSEQLDLGFDARLLNSRLSFVFDWYNKTTKDWLVPAPILASWGVDNAPYINGGEITNKGVEIALGWNDNVGDLTYGISGNMSFNKNEVTKIENSQQLINATNVKLWGNGPYIARAEVGHPVGYFWGYKTDGLFQNMSDVTNYKNAEGKVIMPNALPGDVKFVDTDGNGVIEDADKVQIGDPNPDMIYSMNLNLGYKGFDFLVSFYGVSGNQIAYDWHDAGSPQNNYTTEILGRWHGEGTSNRIPRVTDGSSINQQYTSDLQIQNGDYLRISNLTIGYDFKTLFKAVPMQQLRIFFSAQNLYTFTKYTGMDPAIGTSTDDSGFGWVRGVDLGFYPAPRTYMLGLSLKF